MQIPAVAECMTCHESIKKDSPAIQQLAQLRKDNQTISWVRLYRLPDYVFFSHEKHINAKVDCEVCHGRVQDRDALGQEKEISMVTCIDCHKLRKASVSCNLCHDIGH